METAGKATTKKKMLATLVGCNYAGTPHELCGCINDVLAMRDALVGRFGFAPRDVAVLTDDDARVAAAARPTGSNVKRALADMVARAAPGDVLVFHYSGHGTLVPPRDRRRRRRGRAEDDEAIVPCDFNLITDVDFRQLVDRVPRGATFTMVSDSCHSGGLIDQEKEQIGPSVVDDDDDDATPPAPAPAPARARFLPYAAVLGHLSAASGLDAASSHHHVGEHLLALFGADASAKFHLHYRHHADDDHHHSAPAPGPDDDAGILLSGCQADVAEGGEACGAFSAALQAVLRAHPAPISNRDLVARARAALSRQGFEQHPCLYCGDANADAPFLCQKKEKEEGEPAPAAAMPALL